MEKEDGNCHYSRVYIGYILGSAVSGTEIRSCRLKAERFCLSDLLPAHIVDVG